MKCAYKFSNLLGTVYHKGDLIFSSDGTTLISPVGNRITIFDLKNNKSETLPVQSRYNYNAMDLSPNGCILIAVNEEGEAHFISMISKMIIHKYRFKRRVRSVKFSPDGKHFAVCKENNVFIFNVPGLQIEEYNPFAMERVFTGATDETTCMQWSFDSKILAVGSKDTSVRLYSLEKWNNFRSYSFACHSDRITGCFFEEDTYDLSTISRDGHFCVWECSIAPEDLSLYETPAKKSKLTDDVSDEEDDVQLDKALESTEKQKRNSKSISNNPDTNDEVMEKERPNKDETKKLRYKRLGKHYLADPVKKDKSDAILTAATYHVRSRILVVGFSNGAFFLYSLPDVSLIHSLSIANENISSISFNFTGDWIALGCSEVGQLLVWEWQSETYALKQQGHSNNMNCLCYNPNGQYIVTGGQDGKVKVWNTLNGFCNVTFNEHISSVTGVLFSRNQKFIVSSSLDGSIRAYDLVRYRNFKTFTTPRPVQFSCIALDSSDEFLAAGGQDVFEIYLWSIKLGSLLEILCGHEGPVASLAFSPSPTSTALASASWDKTLRLWNAIENDSKNETIQLTADALCVVYRPDGEEVAVSTLDGQIHFFDCKTSTQTGSIEGKKDLGSGRSDTDLVSAKKSMEGKAFTSLCYSADGSYIIAGGQSKNVCIYSVKESLLLKKFEITQNRSLDAVDDFINRRKLTEFGNTALIEEREENEGGNVVMRLPGVKRGDMASRSTKPEIRVFSLQYSPTGQSWAAATTEGLLIYSLDTSLVFDPFHLDMGITPESIRSTLHMKEYSTALMMALKLNEVSLIRQVVENVPYHDISLTLTGMPSIYVEKVLKFIASELEGTKHIQFYLKWVETILTEQGEGVNALSMLPVLLMLQKNTQRKYDDLSKICDFNQYTVNYLKKIGQHSTVQDLISIDECPVIEDMETN